MSFQYYRGASVITGASAGIGRAIMTRLAKGRRRSVIGIARNEKRLQEICNEIKSEKKTAQYRCQDLSKISEIKDFSQKLQNDFPKIDSLILNAGLSNNVLFENTTHQQRLKEFQLNYFASAELIQSFIPFFKQKKRGRILVVASLTAYLPFPGNANYAASKAALASLIRNLSIELAESPVEVAMVLPGLTATDMSKNLTSPIRRISPEAVATSVEKALKSKNLYEVPGIENQLALRLDRVWPEATNFATKWLGRFFVPGYRDALNHRERR